jgi:sodium-dependent dicarboxylate transporter 2/3/5
VTHTPPTTSRIRARRIGLIAGPLAALACYALLPERYLDASEAIVSFTPAGRATLAIMVWMAIWWLTEAIDLAATALLPLVLFPLTGVAEIRAAAAPYAHPLIFLFLGGFILARALEDWGLDRRVALWTLRLVGDEPRRMIGGMMAGTALLSMFVSNTATAAMMLPIALSVARLAPSDAIEHGRFSTCLLLGIAYAASIGGIGTIIGTPPNALLVGFIRDTIAEPYRLEISFARWLAVGLPLVAVFLPLTWFLLTRVLYPVRTGAFAASADFVRDELRTLGPVGRGGWTATAVFAFTAAAWVLRPLIVRVELLGTRPFAGLSDSGVAMTGALLLFLVPVDWREGRFAMSWSGLTRLPWGILFLFGGGLSLASAVQTTRVADFIGSLVGRLPDLPPILLVLAVATLVIFLTELTSNTATTATLLPILAALAPGLDVHPYLLIFPAALAASCAFMMPVATPPNAIIFGSGHVTLPQMCRAGLWLNCLGILIVTALTFLVVRPLLAIP